MAWTGTPLPLPLPLPFVHPQSERIFETGYSPLCGDIFPIVLQISGYVAESGRSSLLVNDGGINKPTAYKQNLTELQQMIEVPSVVSSHISGTSVRS